MNEERTGKCFYDKTVWYIDKALFNQTVWYIDNGLEIKSDWDHYVYTVI